MQTSVQSSFPAGSAKKKIVKGYTFDETGQLERDLLNVNRKPCNEFILYNAKMVMVEQSV